MTLTRKLPPIPRPKTTTTIVRNGGDGLYLPGALSNHQLEGIAFELYDSTTPAGKPYPIRAGVIHDVDAMHAGGSMRDLLLDCPVHPNGAHWGGRCYGLSESASGEPFLVERVVAKGFDLEHGFYNAHALGAVIYRDCAALDCGAQGLQVRLTGNRQDPRWANSRSIVVERFLVLECGRKSGAGRAGFGISIKDQGPNTSVYLRDVFVRTEKQSKVAKRSDGTWADSFGGLCVEFCAQLEVHGGYVGMRNPDRPAVQLFDYANKGATSTGPKRIEIHGLEVDFAGDIAVREGDGESCVIADCKGAGAILVQRRGTDGKWRTHHSVPIAEGLTL